MASLEDLGKAEGGCTRAIAQGRRTMRTVAEYLEKAEAFETLAATPTTDLKTSYLELARGYRELAEQRQRLLNCSADEGSLPQFLYGAPAPSKAGGTTPQSN
jgi:hypothetical protein